MKLVLSLATSAGTVLGMWLVGRKRASGWVVGIANQGLWLALIIVTRAWGLLVLLVVLLWIYGRNLWLWAGPRCADGRTCALHTHRTSCPRHPRHPEYGR